MPGEQVPIVVRMNSVFVDQTLYAACEEMGICYVWTAELYRDLKARIERRPSFAFQKHEFEEQAWRSFSFFDWCGSWDRSRRAVADLPRFATTRPPIDLQYAGSTTASPAQRRGAPRTEIGGPPNRGALPFEPLSPPARTLKPGSTHVEEATAPATIHSRTRSAQFRPR